MVRRLDLRGVRPRTVLPIIRPLYLTESEISRLAAFLESLTEEVKVEVPEVP